MEIKLKNIDSLYNGFSKLSGRHSKILIHFYNLLFLPTLGLTDKREMKNDKQRHSIFALLQIFQAEPRSPHRRCFLSIAMTTPLALLEKLMKQN